MESIATGTCLNKWVPVVNDTEVESEKFNSIAENYGLLEMSTVSYSGGIRVVSEQMDKVYNAYSDK